MQFVKYFFYFYRVLYYWLNQTLILRTYLTNKTITTIHLQLINIKFKNRGNIHPFLNHPVHLKEHLEFECLAQFPLSWASEKVTGRFSYRNPLLHPLNRKKSMMCGIFNARRLESISIRRAVSRSCVSTVSATLTVVGSRMWLRVILRKLPVRGHFARMENRCPTATLDRLKIRGERGRSPTKIPVAPTLPAPLCIYALLIFTLLKDLSATRSAVIPAAPEYRSSIKRRWWNCVRNWSLQAVPKYYASRIRVLW